MHALRLGVQGVELLRTGRITLPVPEPDLSFLDAVINFAVRFWGMAWMPRAGSPRSRGGGKGRETWVPREIRRPGSPTWVTMLRVGSWGVGIFSNDDAADIREDFRDLIAEGHSPDVATERLRDEYGVGGRGVDDNDFWLGLAAAQHSVGHVVPDVIERAISIIDSPEELTRWESSDQGRRRAALEKLRVRLLEPPPAPKRLRRRQKVDTTLEPGQHVLFADEERQVLLRVTRINSDKGGRYPHAVLVDWDGSDRRLRKAHRLPAVLDPTPQRDDEALGFLLIGEPRDPAALTVLPVRTDRRTPARRWESAIVTKWSDLGRHLPSAQPSNDPPH